jgi:hypothetical protein
MSAANSGQIRSTTPKSRASAQQLFHLSPHALRRQIVQGDRGTDRARRGGYLQFEPRRELQRAQDAQAVVGEREGIDDTEDALLQIGTPLEGIDQRAVERVPRDRVDGEVAASGRLLDAHRGVSAHVEALVAAARLRFPAGQGDVDVVHLVDGERLADGLHAAVRGEHGGQL